MSPREDGASLEKIMTAARVEFAEEGFAGARIDSIAKRSGLNKAMIYYHFKSKEELYEHLVSSIAGGVLEKVNDAAAIEGTPVEKLYSLLREYGMYISQLDPNCLRIMIREIAGGGKYFKKIAVPKLLLPVFKTVKALIKEAIKKGEMRKMEPVLLIVQVVGSILFFNLMRVAVSDTPLAAMVFGRFSAEKYIDSVLGVLDRGIMAGETK